MLVKDVLALNNVSRFPRLSQISVQVLNEGVAERRSIIFNQEEVYYDPVQENDTINNLAPIKDAIMSDESEGENGAAVEEPRTSSEIRSGLHLKINAARKFDIKQLKVEIWKILEPRIPAYYREANEGTQDAKIHLQKNKDAFTFMDLLKSLGDMIDNAEMLESLSIHQTFLCILHLANEFSLRLVTKGSGALDDPNDFSMFIEDPGVSQTQHLNKVSEEEEEYDEEE